MSYEAIKEQGALQTNPRVAFSDKLDAFRPALDFLYIPNNPSGRIKFREKWPEIAAYLFEDELIKFDNEGTKDFDRRAVLEEAAEERRARIRRILGEFEGLSVDSSFLNLEYIGKVIDEIGVMIATYLYADNVIERVRPGLLATLKKPVASAQPPKQEPAQTISEPQLTPEEKTILSNARSNDTALENAAPIMPSAPIEPALPPVSAPETSKTIWSKGMLKSAFNVISTLKLA
jgi:hypothetical protein